MIGECHARKKNVFKKKKIPVTAYSPPSPLTPTNRSTRISFAVTLESKTAAPPVGRFFFVLNAGLAEVDFERQRADLLAILRLLDSDGDHGAQVEGVDFVGVVQELFVSVDAQLEKTQNGGDR